MNKESKTYKSVKTVSKSGAVSWRPRWVEFDSDGNKKIRNGKSQSSKAEADRFSRKILTIRRKPNMEKSNQVKLKLIVSVERWLMILTLETA